MTHIPTCRIVGAGDFFGIEKIYDGDFVIAADGGLKCLERLGISPDMIIGDFDSLGKTPQGENIIVLSAEKDDTDMGAAVELGLERGYKRFVLYGATGGRAEHTIANIQLIAKLSQQGVQAYIEDKDSVFTCLTDGKISFDENAQGFVSVFSHTDSSLGVTLKGLKYELKNAELHNNFALGVSNEFCGKNSTVSVEHGTLMIIYPKNVRLNHNMLTAY